MASGVRTRTHSLSEFMFDTPIHLCSDRRCEGDLVHTPTS